MDMLLNLQILPKIAKHNYIFIMIFVRLTIFLALMKIIPLLLL
jgi:hypothetical protein